jgi:hypothetical protein
MNSLKLALFLIVSFPIVAWAASPSVEAPTCVTVSAREMRLGANERIYGFRLDVAGALVRSTKVPFQWNLTVDNSDGERSHLKANTVVGASAFGPEDLDYFQCFVQIERLEHPFLARFAIALVLEVTDEATGQKRYQQLPAETLSLSRAAACR